MSPPASAATGLDWTAPERARSLRILRERTLDQADAIVATTLREWHEEVAAPSAGRYRVQMVTAIMGLFGLAVVGWLVDGPGFGSTTLTALVWAAAILLFLLAGGDQVPERPAFDAIVGRMHDRIAAYAQATRALPAADVSETQVDAEVCRSAALIEALREFALLEEGIRAARRRYEPRAPLAPGAGRAILRVWFEDERRPVGTSRVYVDGVLRAAGDTRTLTPAFLAPGAHAVEVRWFDGVDVRTSRVTVNLVDGQTTELGVTAALGGVGEARLTGSSPAA